MEGEKGDDQEKRGLKGQKITEEKRDSRRKQRKRHRREKLRENSMKKGERTKNVKMYLARNSP